MTFASSLLLGFFSAQRFLSRSTMYRGLSLVTRTNRVGQLCLRVCLLLAVPCLLHGQSRTATSAALTVSVSGSAASTTALGSTVTLSSTVTASGSALTHGQVNFCDAGATSCSDIHLLGVASLTSSGKATLAIRPGIGSHSYKAIFAGTTAYSGSTSPAASIQVTGTTPIYATTTAIGRSGSFGNYTLTGTVTEAGGTIAPTGQIAFLDTSNNNKTLAASTLGAAVASVAWPTTSTVTLDRISDWVSIGDFNGDGIPDFATVAGAPGTRISVYLGKADGSYTRAPDPYAPGYLDGPIAVGDVNGDGNQDLIVVDGDANVIRVLLGNGDGTFTASASTPSTPAQPLGVAIADLDGDGNPDIVVASGSSTNLTVLPGKGDGTFTQTSTRPAAGIYASAVSIADFNKDGVPDLAVTPLYGNSISILLGKGDGTFSAASTVAATQRPSSLIVADVNGDGQTDLVVGEQSSSTTTSILEVFTGDGDGTFSAPASTALNATSPSIQAGDFNGDGVVDVALFDTSSQTFSVLLNNGSAKFKTVTDEIPTEAGYSPVNFAIADLDGDGRSDLVIGGSFNENLQIYLTRPTETASATANITVGGVGAHLVEASYSGDSAYGASISPATSLYGVPPTTTTNLVLTSGSSVVSSVNAGTVVTLTATVSAGTSSQTIGQVSFCDGATQCSDIHLLATQSLAANGTATYKFIPGPGAHSFRALFLADGYGVMSSSSVAALTVGALAAPKYTDTVTLGYGQSNSGYALTATVQGIGGTAAPTGQVNFLDTSFGNKSLGSAMLGSSTPGLGFTSSQTALASSNPVTEAAGDFDGDGIPDLAVLSCENYGQTCDYTIFLGKGDGTFKPGSQEISIPGSNSGSNFVGIYAGDFNNDGKLDLLLRSYDYSFNSSVITLLGNGSGTFTTSATSVVSTPVSEGGDVVPGSLTFADFNGDGKLDLAIVGDSVNGGVSIALGKGDGTFTLSPNELDPAQAYGLIVSGDFNGDGIPDLIATTYFSSTSVLYLGVGDGNFVRSANSLSIALFTKSMVVGDFNGDGKLDLAVGESNGISIFLGAGDGSFTQASGSPITGVATYIAAGDFNGDGKLDLVGTDANSAQATLFLGMGDGTFSASTPVTPVGNPSSYQGPQATVATDFNGDGVTDLAVLLGYTPQVTTLLTAPSETASASINNVLPVGAGNHNVVASYVGDANYPSGTSAPVTLAAILATVTATPASGSYSSAQTVTLSEALPGATIYYAAYGPVATHGFVPYTGPILLNLGGSETIEAYATETGYQQSNYTVANYTLNFPTAPTPVISPAAGSFASTQTVTITNPATNAAIYYTTDGSYPYLNSTLYTGPLTVSTSETVSAIAIAPGYSPSQIATSQFVIDSSPSSFIYTVAGSGAYGYEGDGGPATRASLAYVEGVALDSAGNLFFADPENNVVRRVDAKTAVLTTVAGTGQAGYSGDNGAATSAQLNSPIAVAFDAAGNLYIADRNNFVVRKVDAKTATITTVAGNGTSSSDPTSGPATSLGISYPMAIAIDSGGNLYIGTYGLVRKVTAATGTIATFAGGSSNTGSNGDGGPATSATLGTVQGLGLDSAGNLYIADANNSVVRKVTAATGIITTVAGSTTATAIGDGGPATSAQLIQPRSVAVDSSGNLFIADTGNGIIREVNGTTGIIKTVAGRASANCRGLSGDGGPSLSATLCSPQGIALDTAGDIYIAETYSFRIRKATATATPPTQATATPSFSLAAGTYAQGQTLTISDATPGTEIYVSVDDAAPTTLGQGYRGPITISGSGTVQAIAVAPGYLPSTPVSATYTISTPPESILSVVAGTGNSGPFTTGGAATSTNLANLSSVAVDTHGNQFIADFLDGVILKVSADTGLIQVFAGTYGVSTPDGGDGGPATSATLYYPQFVACDAAGNVYISEFGAGRVRKVDAKTGIITTIAGTGNYGSASGDGGPATSAAIIQPGPLTLDASGNLYVADQGTYVVRKIDGKTGIISTIAGDGKFGYSGDGGQATSAMFEQIYGLAVDGKGDLYIADTYNGRIRYVDSSTGIVTTIAGSGLIGSSGDGGPPTQAHIYPFGLALDPSGNLYFANGLNTLRKLAAGGSSITTVAGTGYYGSGGAGSSATMANLCSPQGIALDNSGSVYISEYCNNRVSKITFPTAAATPVFTPAAGTYTGAQTVTISDATAGATIYYTSDGSTPTTASTAYTGAITVSSTQTLKAIAVATGYTVSGVASSAYTINMPLTPALTLASSDNPALLGDAVTFTATVSSASGTPTGTVSFLDGTTPLGTATLSAGSAALMTASLTAGSHSITAVYSGDSAFATATSTALTQVVNSTAIGTPSGGSSTATVTAGGTATYMLQATPPSTGPNLTFSITGMPNGATATFSPSTVAAGSGTTNVTLTIAVPTTAQDRPLQGPFGPASAPIALGMLLLPFSKRTRRASKGWLLLLIAASALAAGATGCSSGGGGGGGTAPAERTYNLTVTASAGSFSQSTSLTLNVK